MNKQMNKKGFIDFEEINYAAVGLGLLGGFFAFFLSGRVEGTGFVMRVSTLAITSVVCFFIVNKMFADG